MSSIVTAARIVGANNADNAADTSLVAANRDGSVVERLEDLKENGPTGLATATGVGTRFWVKKTLVSSAIVTGGVDVTGVSTVGELAITDVVAKTDATGLAAATNLSLETDNAKGLPAFFVTAVSGLGASKTIDLANASVTKIKTVLETGKKVVAKATVTNSTGSGTIDLYIQFERLTAGATVAAA